MRDAVGKFAALKIFQGFAVYNRVHFSGRGANEFFALNEFAVMIVINGAGPND